MCENCPIEWVDTTIHSCILLFSMLNMFAALYSVILILSRPILCSMMLFTNIYWFIANKLQIETSWDTMTEYCIPVSVTKNSVGWTLEN